jgi:transcriptional regulator with XRE-family HTH domain
MQIKRGVMDKRIEESIGSRIKSLREGKKLTLARLSELTGLSKGLLSRIENGKVSSPVSTLLLIADSLKVRLAFLIDEDEGKPQPRCVMVKKEDMTRLDRGTNDFGFYYDMIAVEKTNKKMIPSIITVENKNELPLTFTHPGEEFLHILEGRMEFSYGNDRYLMKAGDSIYFESDMPHRGQNIDDSPLKVLMVICEK